MKKLALAQARGGIPKRAERQSYGRQSPNLPSTASQARERMPLRMLRG
ncbi:MAG: hypothetical protein WCC32_09345 [Terriglobales bacterium]